MLPRPAAIESFTSPRRFRPRRTLILLFELAYGVDKLVGRLGFEPRQSASKALDLPLVDRPVTKSLAIQGLAPS